MKRLIVSDSKNKSNNYKKIKEINEAKNYAQNFTIRFQNIYNAMLEREPIVKSLLDIQSYQVYKIMLEKLKRSLNAFNKNTITNKLNLMMQNLLNDNKSETDSIYNVSNVKYKTEKNKIYKKAELDATIEQAKQLKSDLIYIKTELEALYDQGEVLAEKTKKLLDYHAKNSVLKRIKNINTVVRWLNNEDAFDTDIIGRLDLIIEGNMPRY